ncbi:MAG: hypothetical protein HY828_13320 [Actinobacteria bacterium]|nr:hypothetical protein [Actinomycetota bacterium]
MWLLPRLRLVLARRPWLYWLVVAVCATIVWLQWSAVQSDAERARRSWGASRTVVVAIDTALTGEPLRVELRDYPVAMVPPDALTEAPPEAVAAREVVAGSVLVPFDVLGDDDIPAEWVVLAVPSQDAPSFTRGQRAATFAGGVRTCDGIVDATTVDHVEVAVPSGCAATLTVDLFAGAVVLARLP